jgi:uncharacterized protein with HEPN domain
MRGLGSRPASAAEDLPTLNRMRDQLSLAVSGLDTHRSPHLFGKHPFLVAFVQLHLQFFLESSTRISKPTCLECNVLDWSYLYRLRNIYTHEYWLISAETIWLDLRTNELSWKRGIKATREYLNTSTHHGR